MSRGPAYRVPRSSRDPAYRVPRTGHVLQLTGVVFQLQKDGSFSAAFILKETIIPRTALFAGPRVPRTAPVAVLYRGKPRYFRYQHKSDIMASQFMQVRQKSETIYEGPTQIRYNFIKVRHQSDTVLSRSDANLAQLYKVSVEFQLWGCHPTMDPCSWICCGNDCVTPQLRS